MRNLDVPHNTEDRDWWYQHGKEKEWLFVQMMGNQFTLNEEKKIDETANDLTIDGRYRGDLKWQGTPFFTASRYGFDPQHTVTFNVKDFRKYNVVYPNLQLFFWVQWEEQTKYGTHVLPHQAVYYIHFQRIKTLVLSNHAPVHEYEHRKGKEGNAKDSFLLDVRGMMKLR